METKIEATIKGFGFRGYIGAIARLCWGYTILDSKALNPSQGQNAKPPDFTCRKDWPVNPRGPKGPILWMIGLGFRV